MTKFEKVIKELRWLQFNFPWQDNPENDADKMSNAIHKYTGDAIELLESRQWRKFEFREPDAEEKEAHPEWINVLVGGPYDGDEILVSNGRYVWKDEFYVDDCCHLESDCDLEDCWWMPLPEPPKEGDRE